MVKDSEKAMFKTPGPSPEGLAWDGEALWIVDEETKKLYRLSTKQGKVLKSFSVVVDEPKGLAWDGSSLWVSDNARKTISKVEVRKGKIVSEIRAPIPAGEGPKSLEGLAWDGSYLWSACFAGWSSTFFRLSPKDGSTKLSFFCESNPKGLASNGKYLWSICYNGEKFPSVIDRRVISEKPLEMAKSRSFLVKIPAVKRPTGLAFDGANLLIADKTTRSVYSLEAKKLG